ncbi:hypothetical protein F4803DRAFT_64691 [Xylaria telfairii]|nr:hypothetical protein F4803DRAFT_64691 [Xylaria telfairii]
MAPVTKTRAPRLRASCDGCFIAKVKCSKQRPCCNRCLVSGQLCHYSPSSRAGKPKTESSNNNNNDNNNNNNNPTPILIPTTYQMPQPMYSAPDNMPMQYLPQQISSHIFSPGGWGMPTTCSDGPMAANPAIANNIGMLGYDDTGLSQLDQISAAHSGFYQTPTPWDPNMTSTVFPNGPIAGSQMPLVQTRSFDTSMQMLGDQTQEDMGFYSQPCTSPDTKMPTLVDPNSEEMVYYPLTSPDLNLDYLPSPNTTPIVQPTPNHSSSRDNCRCFNGCIQSLFDLHNASSRNPTPLDLVLALNEKAVEEAAGLIKCRKCTGQSGADTTTLFLQALLYKTALSYRAAIHAHCRFDNMAIRQGNGYAQNDQNDKMRKAELLGTALRTLQDVFARFRGQYETALTIAVMARIDHVIKSTLAHVEMVLAQLANNNTNGGTKEEIVTEEKGV